MDLYVGAGGLGYLDYVSLREQADYDAPPTPDPNGWVPSLLHLGVVCVFCWWGRPSSHLALLGSAW